ncbi:MAG: serine/threonine protein kinase, partial [Planctomycetales bacterium]
RSSKLVDSRDLDPVVEELERDTGLSPPETEDLAARLIEGKLLTLWQHEKLADGRSEGFFLGKYKLLDHLGSGGMGDVFLAEHRRLQRKTAIKVLPSALTDNPQLLRRFHQEARATAALDHPNIVRAYDVDEENGVHYLVMEYVEGEDLQVRVSRTGWLPARDIADGLRQAADALAHAHARQMIHRDVKPSNLLLDPNGVVKVLDMGVARFLEQEDQESLTLAGHEEVLGTVDYLAPEQLVDPHSVDGRADLYSLGCTMFFLLVGKAPFAEGMMAQRLMAHQMKPPPDILQFRPDAPEDLIAICYKLMEKAPEDRYQSAEELSQALSQWLVAHAGEGPRIERKSGPLPPAPGDSWAESTAASRELLTKLVSQNVLTEYQVEALAGNAENPLNVGPYQIRERIASGRLEGVCRGLHSMFHFPVCLTMVQLPTEESEREPLLARFQREARISIQVNHRNVVRAYDVGQRDDLCFICVEELNGQSLLEWLAEERPFSLRTVCRMGAEAALGLSHLHEQQIVHRDVNPNNLWLTDRGSIKVMSFGLARDALSFLDSPQAETPAAEGEFVGAIDYLAPEQAVDCNDATAASDLYSLGCSLYHLLTGKAPFAEEGVAKKMLMHAKGTPLPPSQVNPQVPAELDEIILRMMDKDPARRYHTSFIVAQLLEMFTEE